jgi:mRNA-degrading endonuclease RelE of RelBE toxin-antitoxin system
MLKISLSFLKSLTSLSSERMKKIPKFVQMLQSNPNLPSLNLEHLASVDLYSARIDDCYRAILCRRGADYILLTADKHEKAYRWAEQDACLSQSAALPVEPYVSIASGKLEEAAPTPLGKPEPSTTSPTTSLQRGEFFHVGSIHTWNELREHFAWDSDKKGYYLPERNGHVVCACLRAELNPSAPWAILVGKEPPHLRKAELLVREPSPIPVFIKQAVDQWEYWGHFRFERCEKDSEKMRPVLPENRRNDTSMILYLSEVE